MKVIIAGSRTIPMTAAYQDLLDIVIIESGMQITEVVSGCARGVDRIGERWARDNGIPVKTFPVSKAEWHRVGAAAGPKRNRRMAEYADALIAIHRGDSPGTANMIHEAEVRGLRVFAVRVGD